MGGDDTAVGGGAIYRDGGSLTVIDCVFIDNRAPSPGQDIAGGAIYGFGGGETSIAGSTFTNNAASNGGAVGSLNGHLSIVNCTFGTGLTLVNTIVAGNTSMYRPSCDVTRTDGRGNLQWPAGSLCTTNPTIADPLLGALGDHGGPTPTMVPGASSPARRLGTACPTTDQQGHPRAEPCTAGAVEVP